MNEGKEEHFFFTSEHVKTSVQVSSSQLQITASTGPGPGAESVEANGSSLVAGGENEGSVFKSKTAQVNERKISSSYPSGEYLNISGASGPSSSSWFSCDLADAVNSFIHSSSEYEREPQQQMDNKASDICPGSNLNSPSGNSNSNPYIYFIGNCPLQEEGASAMPSVSPFLHHHHHHHNHHQLLMKNEQRCFKYPHHQDANETHSEKKDQMIHAPYSPQIGPSVSSETVSSTTIFYSGREVNLVNSLDTLDSLDSSKSVVNCVRRVRSSKSDREMTKKYKCSWCHSAVFKSGQGLRFHRTIRCPERNKYLGVKFFKCPRCSKGFITQKGLTAHSGQVH